MVSRILPYSLSIGLLVALCWTYSAKAQGRRDVTDTGNQKTFTDQQVNEAIDLEGLDIDKKSARTVGTTATTAAVDESATPVLTKTEKNSTDTTSDATLFRMIAGLAVVACMGGGALFYIRRKGMTGGLKKDGTEIRMVSQHHLGPRKSIAVVKVAGESVLIGVTDHQITLLKSLTMLDEEETFEDSLDQSTLDDNDGLLEQFRSKNLTNFVRRRSNARI